MIKLGIPVPNCYKKHPNDILVWRSKVKVTEGNYQNVLILTLSHIQHIEIISAKMGNISITHYVLIIQY